MSLIVCFEIDSLIRIMRQSSKMVVVVRFGSKTRQLRFGLKFSMASQKYTSDLWNSVYYFTLTRERHNLASSLLIHFPIYLLFVNFLVSFSSGLVQLFIAGLPLRSY